MTDHCLPHRPALPFWHGLTTLWSAARENHELRRSRRAHMRAKRELAELPEHLLRDIGFYDN